MTYGFGYPSALLSPDQITAALKRTNLGGQTPIYADSTVSCGFLRKSAMFCESLLFPCASQILCFLGKGKNLQQSARIYENLQLGSHGLSP